VRGVVLPQQHHGRVAHDLQVETHDVDRPHTITLGRRIRYDLADPRLSDALHLLASLDLPGTCDT
jgi:hypothetical protein